MAFSTRFGLCTALATSLTAGLWLAPGIAQDKPALPQSMPAPQADPRKDAEPQSDKPTEPESTDQSLPATTPAPAPDPREEEKPADEQPATDEQALPAAPPEPQVRPTEGKLIPPSEMAKPAEPAKPADPAKTAEKPVDPDAPKPIQGPPVPTSVIPPMPPEELACRADLKKLGATFEERKAETGEDGCYLPYPLSVSNFGGGIAVEPPILVNCATAKTSAEFLQKTAQPQSEKSLGSKITGIANGSGYVCRTRNGTQKLSEHALGNAIDIMSFTLEDKRTVTVEKTTDKVEQEFLDAVRKAACGPFKTVLGPGSDADHANHFHLDLAERTNGGTFCQ